MLEQFAVTLTSRSETVYIPDDLFYRGLIVLAVFLLFVYMIFCFLLARIFAKARLRKWQAWVPVYNTWKLLELGDQPGVIAVTLYFPYASYFGAFFLLMATYNINKRFGKSSWFWVLSFIFPVIWLGVLAYDKSRFRKSIHTSLGPNRMLK